jgi:hypothetical protein
VAANCWLTDLGGIVVFDTPNVSVYNNVIEDANGHGIFARQDARTYCDPNEQWVGVFCRGDHVTKNLQVYDNTVRAPVDGRVYQIEDGKYSGFILSGTDVRQWSSLGIKFFQNNYVVPASGTSANWFMIDDPVDTAFNFTTWSRWQSLGNDSGGSFLTY